MPKFPEPPADLATVPPRLHRLPAGSELWRVYFRGGRHPGLHANQPAVALYERARPAVAATPFFHRALADPLLTDLLAWAAEMLGYGLTIGRHGGPP